MKTIFKLSFLIFVFSIIGCSSEENNTNTTSLTDLESFLYQKSNIGVYNGVFTTDNGQQQGSIRIEVPDINTPTIGFTGPLFSRATILLSNGKQFVAHTNTPVTFGENIDHLRFNSSAISFSFSVSAKGDAPKISDIVFNDVQSSIIVRKHTTRAPVEAIPGTYACSSCGSHPVLGTGTTQSFNLLMFTNPEGDTDFDTQVTLDMNTYTGIGVQNSCMASGVLTTCAITSGDDMSNVGFTVSTAPIMWSGTHTFNNETSGPQNCSQASGTWSFDSINFGTLTGTFTSNTTCPPAGSTNLVLEGFEDSTVSYVLRNESDGGTIISEDISDITFEDYFGRVMLSDFDDPNYNIANVQGNSFFGVGDMDSLPATPGLSNASMNWENLDVSTLNSVTVKALFASNIGDVALPHHWDSADRVLIEVSTDGGSFTRVFGIESLGITNTQPAIDSNLDGVGDAPLITDTLTEYSVSIDTSTASTLSVRIRFVTLNAGDEDIAIDNVSIDGE